MEFSPRAFDSYRDVACDVASTWVLHMSLIAASKFPPRELVPVSVVLNNRSPYGFGAKAAIDVQYSEKQEFGEEISATTVPKQLRLCGKR